MSKYTTGEIAKLCGVSVRTVQYYDTRGILVPSELSEGGRRLYSKEDLNKMKIICFLRDAGLPLGSIGELLAEEDPGSVISLLLDRQAGILREEMDERQTKLSMIEEIKRELKNVEHFSVESIGDIAYIMENKKKLRRTRVVMIAIGIIAELVELGTILLWIYRRIWWPFVCIGLPTVIALSAWMVYFYYKKIDYICPKCHTVYKPRFRDFFWSAHTPTTRKLTCTGCGHRGFCVETYHTEKE